MQQRARRRLFKWTKIIVIIYCGIGIGAYFLQEKFLFHPLALKDKAAFHFNTPFKEVNVRYDSATKYNIIQFTVPDSVCRGVVLYFHGNKNNVEHYAHVAPYITKHGYEVWMIDYPGFGKSTGAISEQLLYDEALIAYRMARARFSRDSIIIYGRSLGTAIAAELASVRDCKRLILETPYYNMTSVAERYLWMYPVGFILKYKFSTNEYLANVTAPVTIFHGTSDKVILYSNASRLKDVLKHSDEFITIEGGTHNDLLQHKEMTAKLDSVLAL